MTGLVSLVSTFQHEYIRPRKYILREILFQTHKGFKYQHIKIKQEKEEKT